MSSTSNQAKHILPAAELSIEGSPSSPQYKRKASTNPANPKTKEYGESYKGSSNLSINPVFINETPEATRDWHKDILFDLFLRCDKDELQELSKQVPPVVKKETSKFSFIEWNVSSQSPTNPPNSYLSLIPDILRDFHHMPTRNRQIPRNEHVAVNVPVEWKQKTFDSRTLEETEGNVMEMFLKSSMSDTTSQLRISPAVSDQLSLPVSKNVASEQSLSEMMMAVNPSATSEQSDPKNLASEQSSSDTVMAVEPFTLMYNECSLGAISKWATRGDHKWTKKEQDKHDTMGAASFHQPAAETVFRRCTCCGCWGHLELECDLLKEKDILRLSQSTQTQKKLRRYLEEEGRLEVIPKLKSNMSFDASFPLTDTEDHRTAKEVQAPSPYSPVLEAQKIGEYRKEDEYLIKSNGCELCGSGFKGADLLLCDGCDGLFHRQCLDPPLESVPEGDWFCNKCNAYDSDVSSVVDLEGCGRFIIEQRKRSVAEEKMFTNENVRLGFSDYRWCTAASVIERDTFIDNQEEDGNLYERKRNKMEDITDLPVLSSGELCWAKRHAAPKGKLGRNDWWPAMVMVVLDPRAKTNSHAKALGINQTPYVVKFFSLMGAGRVRASDVLPFFENYEEIGQARLFDHNKAGCDEYSKALNEAMISIGCTSLSQVLKRARGIKGNQNSKSARVAKPMVKSDETREVLKERSFERKDAQINYLRPKEWLNADIEEEDDIEILARSIKDINASGDLNMVDSSYVFDRQDSKRVNRSCSISSSKISCNEECKPPLQCGPLVCGEEIPSVDRFVGGTVAWVTRKLAEPKGGLAVEMEAYIQLGIVSSLDLVCGKVLVRSLPKLDDLLAHISDARVQASLENNEEEGSTPKASLHSMHLGTSIWLPIEILSFVGNTPGIRAKNFCETALISALKNAKKQMLKQKQNEAIKREETMVELVERPWNKSKTVNNTGKVGKFVLGGKVPRKKRKRVSNNEISKTLASSGQANAISSLALAVEGSATNHNVSEEVRELDANKYFGKGIYQAERILRERKKNGAKEYLIKWREFDVCDSTWEPEKNILNQNLITFFKVAQLCVRLEETVEAIDPSSLTYRVIQAMKKGMEKLSSGVQVSLGFERKVGRLCPFCMAQYRDGSSYGGHSKRHASENNYIIIREVSRFAEKDWFED